MPSIFDLEFDEQDALQQRAETNLLDPATMPKPAWANAGEQTKQLMQGSASAARSLAMVGAVDPIAKDAAESFLTGERTTRRQDEFFEVAVEGVGQSAVDFWTPDAAASGAAATTLGNVFNVVGRVPQILAGPVGATTFLTDAAVAPGTEVVRAGGSNEAALGAAGVGLVANAVGMRLPAAWGSNLLTRVGTGAGANVAVGAAQNKATQEILEADGLDELAASYDPTNPQAWLLDSLLGVAFGAKAHLDARAVSPSDRAAVLTANNAHHYANGTLPGEPTTPRAAAQHQDALGTAIAQVLKGEPVSVESRVNLADFTLRPELQPAGTTPKAIQADYRRIAEAHGATITSMVRPVIARGAGARSQHPHGTAADFRTKDKTPEQVEALMADLRAAGFEVIDERNTDQPHIHAELPSGGRRASAPAQSAPAFPGDAPMAEFRGRYAFDAETAIAPVRSQITALRADPAVRAGLTAEYEAAARSKTVFDEGVLGVADELGLTRAPLLPSTLKDVGRAFGKVTADYAGDATRLRDLVRGTLVLDEIGQVDATLAAVARRFGEPSKLRNTLRADAPPTSPDGYRDVNVNVVIDGRNVELQLNVPAMLKAKGLAHPLYEEVRSIDAAALKADRDFTPEEVARVHALNAQQREIYDAAWLEATSSSNLSREIGSPSRQNEATENLRGAAPSNARQDSGPGSSATGIPPTSRNSVSGEKLGKSDIGTTSDPSVSQGKVTSNADGAPPPEHQVALEAIAANPGLQVMGDDGIVRSAADFLAEGEADLAAADQTARAVQAAANCLLRFAA